VILRRATTPLLIRSHYGDLRGKACPTQPTTDRLTPGKMERFDDRTTELTEAGREHSQLCGMSSADDSQFWGSKGQNWRGGACAVLGCERRRISWGLRHAHHGNHPGGASQSRPPTRRLATTPSVERLLRLKQSLRALFTFSKVLSSLVADWRLVLNYLRSLRPRNWSLRGGDERLASAHPLFLSPCQMP
jgi:hypothetical protein